MRVAVVEDDRLVREVLGLMLQRAPVITIDFAASTDQAYELPWDRIDAAVIDWQMNRGDSEQLLDWLDTNHPHVRTVILSGHQADQLPDRFRSRHALKPLGGVEMRRLLGLDDV